MSYSLTQSLTMWTPMMTQSDEYWLVVLSIYKVLLTFFLSACHSCWAVGLKISEGLSLGPWEYYLVTECHLQILLVW